MAIDKKIKKLSEEEVYKKLIELEPYLKTDVEVQRLLSIKRFNQLYEMSVIAKEIPSAINAEKQKIKIIKDIAEENSSTKEQINLELVEIYDIFNVNNLKDLKLELLKIKDENKQLRQNI